MTSGAQQALRRTMEIYSNTTRFALACNQSTKVIEPIQSRCAIVRFTKLGDKEILSRVILVCQQEKVSLFTCVLPHTCNDLRFNVVKFQMLQIGLHISSQCMGCHHACSATSHMH